MPQLALLSDLDALPQLNGQLLKWIGNKYRSAGAIIGYFPSEFGTYYEPFLGSGAILATLAPERAVGADVFGPLVEIWNGLIHAPEQLKLWYEERWRLIAVHGKTGAYAKVLASFNAKPNGRDFLFLCRACYGGVVRFRKADGFMSTPCGAHQPIPPDAFARRVDVWHERVRHAEVLEADYREIMRRAEAGDLVYCDPPYAHSQAILYGAQSFELEELFDEIADCKTRGVRVVLSIDGKKRSGELDCVIDAPRGLFEREVFVSLGRSMLKRFQLDGRDASDQEVSDRLLLTY